MKSAIQHERTAANLYPFSSFVSIRSIKLTQTYDGLPLISCFVADVFTCQEDDKPEPSAPQADTVELTALIVLSRNCVNSGLRLGHGHVAFGIAGIASF